MSNRRLEILRDNGTPSKGDYYVFCQNRDCHAQWSQPALRKELVLPALNKGGLSVLEICSNPYRGVVPRNTVCAQAIEAIKNSIVGRELLIFDTDCAIFTLTLDLFSALIQRVRESKSTLVVASDSINYCAYSPFGKYLLAQADASLFLTQTMKPLPRTSIPLRIPQAVTPQSIGDLVIDVDNGFATGLLIENEHAMLRKIPIDTETFW